MTLAPRITINNPARAAPTANTAVVVVSKFTELVSEEKSGPTAKAEEA
jgi:hypothetical protein